MIDRKFIGHEMKPSVLVVDATRLRFFAKAIGETDPVYFDENAAKAAGYAAIPAPPTFLFAGSMDSGAMFDLLDEMEVPLAKVLHGEQQFEYLAPVVAGDTVRITSRVSDIYDKKNGTLEFFVTESTATNQHGKDVARLRGVTVVRH